MEASKDTELWTEIHQNLGSTCAPVDMATM